MSVHVINEQEIRKRVGAQDPAAVTARLGSESNSSDRRFLVNQRELK